MRVNNDDSTFDGASQIQRYNSSLDLSQDSRVKLSIEKKSISSILMRQEIKQALLEQEAAKESILEEFENQ